MPNLTSVGGIERKIQRICTNADVLERSGSVAGGLTRLATVQATYEGRRG